MNITSRLANIVLSAEYTVKGLTEAMKEIFHLLKQEEKIPYDTKNPLLSFHEIMSQVIFDWTTTEDGIHNLKSLCSAMYPVLNADDEDESLEIKLIRISYKSIMQMVITFLKSDNLLKAQTLLSGRYGKRSKYLIRIFHDQKMEQIAFRVIEIHKLQNRDSYSTVRRKIIWLTQIGLLKIQPYLERPASQKETVRYQLTYFGREVGDRMFK